MRFPREDARVPNVTPDLPNRVWRVITRNIDELEALYLADSSEDAAAGKGQQIGIVRREHIMETTACDELLPARGSAEA